MRMKTWTKNNQNGFTAMELLIAILVFLIVAAVSTPFMLGAIQDYRLRGAAWQGTGDLRLARQKSVSSGRPYKLTFNNNTAGSNPNSYIVERQEVGGSWTMDPASRIYLQQPGTPTYVMIDSTSTPANGVIYFKATGVVDMTLTAGTSPWTIKLIDGRAKRYNVIINFVGRVNVTKS